MATTAWTLALGFPVRRSVRKSAPEIDLRFEPSIDFEPMHLIYHITARNSGEEAVWDVLITPRVVLGPFRIVEPPRAIPVLRPGTFGTASFKVEPTGAPAEVELTGSVLYRIGGSKESTEAIVAPLRIDLRPPEMRPVYLSPGALREKASRSFSIQESIELEGDAQVLFPRLAASVAAQRLEKVEEKTHVTGEAFTGQASFHGLDRHGNSYAVRIVASRKATSTLRLLVFVQAEESLFGFFWRVREALLRVLPATTHQP